MIDREMLEAMAQLLDERDKKLSDMMDERDKRLLVTMDERDKRLSDTMDERDKRLSDMMDAKLKPIQEDLGDIKQRVVRVEVTLENVTNRNIDLLFEGQKDTLLKFRQLDSLTEKVEDIQNTVEVL